MQAVVSVRTAAVKVQLHVLKKTAGMKQFCGFCTELQM